jgi:hypothetical protein
MKDMTRKQAVAFRGKKMEEFNHDLARYYQPVKDIIVITEGEEDQSIHWLLNGETSSRPTPYRNPVVIPYKIQISKKGEIYNCDPIPQIKTNFYRKNRICPSHLLAFVCSSLKEEGWNQFNIMEEVSIHWQKLEAKR